MKYTSACNRTHAADACCAPATRSASCTASYLFALDTAILAVSILLSILLGVLVSSGGSAGSDRTGTNYPASRSKAQRRVVSGRIVRDRDLADGFAARARPFFFCIFKPTG
ncbi:MAG: hypothetical protein ACLR01_07910 [Vescimonas sp.]